MVNIISVNTKFSLEVLSTHVNSTIIQKVLYTLKVFWIYLKWEFTSNATPTQKCMENAPSPQLSLWFLSKLVEIFRKTFW